MENKDQDGGYPIDTFENLVFRYEEPNGMTRWDSPLFTVPYDDEAPPFEEIWNALIGTEGELKKVKPNQATVMVGNAMNWKELVKLMENRNLPLNLTTCMSSTRQRKTY